jgi:hypothetical protein
MSVLILSPNVTSDMPDADYADIVLHVSARIMSATRARRKTNGWLCLEVGDRMLAGDPELVIGEQLLWRVPVQWTSPTHGRLAEHVCDLLVDATTGEVLDQASQIQVIQRRVEHAAHSLRSTVK